MSVSSLFGQLAQMTRGATRYSRAWEAPAS